MYASHHMMMMMMMISMTVLCNNSAKFLLERLSNKSLRLYKIRIWSIEKCYFQ